MALEAVDFYRGIAMTAIAEMFTAFHARGLAVCARRHVAIDTFLQAMPFRAYTLMHGFITLVQNKFHVITTHDFGRLHTTFAFGRRDSGERNSVLIAARGIAY